MGQWKSFFMKEHVLQLRKTLGKCCGDNCEWLVDVPLHSEKHMWETDYPRVIIHGS